MKMKAVIATSLGGPEVLHHQDVELQWPRGDHDVLVELHFASINPADIFFRQLGGYLSGDHPFILGHDGMGIVKATGSAVTSVKVGDRVLFGKYSGQTVKVDGNELLVMKEDDLFAVVQK